MAMGEMIDVGRADGSSFPAYVATPAQPGPGVVVCHAYWGLTPHVQRLCDRLAAEGFCALAPSLYDGQSSEIPDDADKLMAALDEDRAEADLIGSLDALLAQPGCRPGPVGAVGFSMGGWAATRLAAARTEVVACAPFYGYSPGADYRASRAAFDGHFALVEDDIDPADFEHRLRGAGREVEVFTYQARHGFFNEDHPEDFDQASERLAWDRVRGLLLARLVHPRP
jgi:carboxymethylenebutenolidase